MLPFTKRPGREESSDVVAKDDIGAKSSPASAVPPASSSRPTTMRPPASTPPAGRANDFDDEMTGLVQARSLNSTFPAPMPAAGRPATMPPRSARPSIRPAAGGPASMRPPPSSARGAYEGDEDEDAEDEDGGRTVVRPEGAGKVARRSAAAPDRSAPRATPSANPTSISPAAVIRKTMESQRARGLASGPPPELRGDLDHGDNDEFTQAAPSRTASSRSGAQRSNYPPPASYEGPPSHRPPPRDEPASYRSRGRDSMDSYDDSHASSPRSYRTNESGPISSSPMSQPPPSSARANKLPGHFAASQPPPSYASPQNGVNPHGPTAAMPAVTGAYNSMPPQMQHASQPPAQMTAAMNNSAMPAHFRMAQTGAIAGVGMGGAVMDPPGTSVTSNNPRVSGRPAMSWAAALAACGVFVGVVAVAIAQRGDNMADTQAAFVDPAHTTKTPATQPVETQPPPTNPLPPGLIGASPAPAVAPVNGMADPNLGLSTPQPPPVAPAPPPDKAGGEKFAGVTVKAPPKPAGGGGATFVRPRPAPRPDTGDGDEEPKKKKTKGGDADDETRKALEELRKAQMERGL